MTAIIVTSIWPTELALARHEANTPHWEEPGRQPSRSLLEARQEFSDIFAVADTLDESVRTEFQDHLKQVKTRLDAALDD